jgi:hypothetical protein
MPYEKILCWKLLYQNLILIFRLENNIYEITTHTHKFKSLFCTKHIDFLKISDIHIKIKSEIWYGEFN